MEAVAGVALGAAGAMVMVRLIADRSPHKDVIYGTNIQWAAPGDIKPVPATAWAKMKVHADVYEEVPAGPTLADAAKVAIAPGPPPGEAPMALVIPTLGTPAPAPASGSAPPDAPADTGAYETPADERTPPRPKPDGRSKEARDTKKHAAVVASLKS